MANPEFLINIIEEIAKYKASLENKELRLEDLNGQIEDLQKHISSLKTEASTIQDKILSLHTEGISNFMILEKQHTLFDALQGNFTKTSSGKFALHNLITEASSLAADISCNNAKLSSLEFKFIELNNLRNNGKTIENQKARENLEDIISRCEEVEVRNIRDKDIPEKLFNLLERRFEGWIDPTKRNGVWTLEMDTFVRKNNRVTPKKIKDKFNVEVNQRAIDIRSNMLNKVNNNLKVNKKTLDLVNVIATSFNMAHKPITVEYLTKEISKLKQDISVGNFLRLVREECMRNAVNEVSDTKKKTK